MIRHIFIYLFSLSICACTGTPPAPPVFVPFDEDMVLSGPVYKMDYQYLLFSVSNRMHKELSGTLTFQPGSVQADHTNGKWTLLSVKRVCIKPIKHGRLMEIVPIEQARSALVSTIVVDNNELALVNTRLEKLGFRLTCEDS